MEEEKSLKTSFQILKSLQSYIFQSKSEREKSISYTNAYVRNLERWCRRIYLQGSYGETDIENRLTNTGRREERVGRMERVT